MAILAEISDARKTPKWDTPLDDSQHDDLMDWINERKNK